MKLDIVDYTDSKEKVQVETPKPLPESLGYNLDTIEKARQWLINPQNWFKSELFILRWEGLIPKISERHGRRLIAEPWDDGLPWTVVYEQKKLRARGGAVEAILDPTEDQNDS